MGLVANVSIWFSHPTLPTDNLLFSPLYYGSNGAVPVVRVLICRTLSVYTRPGDIFTTGRSYYGPTDKLNNLSKLTMSSLKLRQPVFFIFFSFQLFYSN